MKLGNSTQTRLAERPATARAGELLGERGTNEALHAHVVAHTVFLQLPDDPPGDARRKLDELFFVDRLHVF